MQTMAALREQNNRSSKKASNSQFNIVGEIDQNHRIYIWSSIMRPQWETQSNSWSSKKTKRMVLLEDKTHGPITWDLCDIPSGTCAWEGMIIMLD